MLAWAAHFVWNSPWLESLMTQGAGAFVGALIIKGLPFLILLVLWGCSRGGARGVVFAG